MVRNIYVYVRKISTDNCLKYGMKLSEHTNIIIKTNNNIYKKGIHAYFTPRDSLLYHNKNYQILRIAINNNDLKLITFNNTSKNIETDLDIKKEIINITNNFENIATISDKLKKKNFSSISFPNLANYILGTFEYPEIIISSSILPENISIYNKILDVPLLFTTSHELYLNKKEETFMQENLNIVTFNDIKNK